jgi:hypothetical protein
MNGLLKASVLGVSAVQPQIGYKITIDLALEECRPLYAR